ncbi:MAG: cupin-like domain-containing protein [Burkholderiales bacterium]|nr:cupin-like domain-containing protein [Bacteroidia bacterium]
MDLSLGIDAVENIDIEKFNHCYFNTQKPLVIKGLSKDTSAGVKWSIEYFKEIVGNVMVDVYDNSNKKSAKSAFTVPDLKMQFSEYLDILTTNEHTDLRIFLFDLFKYNSRLKKDFPCPDIFKGILDNFAHMFFGSKDTTVRIHYDIDMSNVLLTQFGGKKRVVLIAPEYTSLLYCLPLNTYSLIDPDKPDYKKYPALKHIKGYDFILDPGDSLFMPSGYWHYMTYLESGFSVSYRRIGPTLKSPLQGLINLGLYMPADKLLNKVMNDKWLTLKEQIAERRIHKLALGKDIFCNEWKTINPSNHIN